MLNVKFSKPSNNSLKICYWRVRTLGTLVSRGVCRPLCLPTEGRFLSFLYGPWWIKNTKSFAFTKFVLFAKYCSRVGAKGCVFERLTQNSSAFCFFLITDFLRHFLFKNSKFYKKVPCFQEIRPGTTLELNIPPSRSSWLSEVDLCFKESAKTYIRKMFDGKTQITSFHFSINASLKDRFTWRKKMVP